MANGIFAGLKVLDCASFIAAPAAATVLSDFGADVIKIEPPGAGDAFRMVPKLPGMPQSDHPYGWLLDNRNKRGLALDLTKSEGQWPLPPSINFITRSQPRGLHLSPTSSKNGTCAALLQIRYRSSVCNPLRFARQDHRMQSRSCL